MIQERLLLLPKKTSLFYKGLFLIRPFKQYVTEIISYPFLYQCTIRWDALEAKGRQFYVSLKQLITLVSVFDCRKKPGWAQSEGCGHRPGSGGNSAVSISFVAAAAVDGQWQEWSSWSQCSVTCSNGTQQRSRQCTAAAHGGSECRGPWAESRECHNPECTGE